MSDHEFRAGFEVPGSKPSLDELSSPLRPGAGGRAYSDLGAGYAGSMSSREDPVRRKRGGSLALYDDVLADDQVHSNFQQRRRALIARELEVLPGGTDKASEMAADFLREMLSTVGWDRVCDKMMYGIMYGYAVSELLYARDGRYWTIDEIKVRRPARFTFGADASLRLKQVGRPGGLLMPERKFWTYTSGADNDDNPFGVPLAAWCYWPVFFKRNGIRFWMLALEKYGAPTAVGKYPPNAPTAEKQKLLEAVQAFASSAALTIPLGMDIELLSAGSKVGGNHSTLIETMNASISKVILSQTMTTDASRGGGVGNSQGDVHLDVRKDVTKGDADLQNGSFNAGPARWLTEWNFPTAQTPIVTRIMDEPEDLDTQSDRDGKLYTMGYELTPERVLSAYGDGYQRRVKPDASLDKPTRPEFSANPDDDYEPIDNLIESEDHLDALSGEMEALLAEINDVLSDSSDFADARNRLTAILAVDPADPFATRLARTQFQARLSAVLAEVEGDDGDET